jgi:hypothetical protein
MITVVPQVNPESRSLIINMLGNSHRMCGTPVFWQALPAPTESWFPASPPTRKQHKESKTPYGPLHNSILIGATKNEQYGRRLQSDAEDPNDMH